MIHPYKIMIKNIFMSSSGIYHVGKRGPRYHITAPGSTTEIVYFLSMEHTPDLSQYFINVTINHVTCASGKFEFHNAVSKHFTRDISICILGIKIIVLWLNLVWVFVRMDVIDKNSSLVQLMT